ncbi:hypothetical protein Ddye_026968 [Dipteronia dyeriana]|uniref:Uncharacterized protein n=1 Tax=Dipteronia dyeriana TaxID=168575 RepID=A0AAD9TP05_9ROSI|nr:hypothetical protein Ddye_026968 [Dipteronia dyeriana]
MMKIQPRHLTSCSPRLLFWRHLSRQCPRKFLSPRRGTRKLVLSWLDQDPLKVEEKLGDVPRGLSTDSDVMKSNKDIVLRELISNAFDALDKIRLLSQTDKEVLGEGDDAKLEIQIKLDKEKKILSILDRGIGMSKEDLIKNLGTIAKSGSSDKWRPQSYWQLGVGFYSVYLIADYVKVISKHNDDKQ